MFPLLVQRNSNGLFVFDLHISVMIFCDSRLCEGELRNRRQKTVQLERFFFLVGEIFFPSWKNNMRDTARKSIRTLMTTDFGLIFAWRKFFFVF